MSIDTLRQRLDGLGKRLGRIGSRVLEGVSNASGRLRGGGSQRNIWPGVGIAAIVIALVVVGLLAYDLSRENLIVGGTTVEGVDVGDMTPPAAAIRLGQHLSGSLVRPVVVSAAGRQFVLDPAQSQIRPEVASMSQSSFERSRGSNFVSRSIQNVFGFGHSVSEPARISYSPQAVAATVATVSQQVDHPARDASVTANGDSLVTVPQADGLVVNAPELSQAIVAQLENPGPDRTVVAPMTVEKPHVTVDQLPALNPAYIIVDRSRFKLLFFKNLQLAKTYPIAVGMQGLETPGGLHHVEDKQVNPSWHVPDSAWAGGLAGQVIPPGPQDPIKARWMGIGDGDGIHGTDETGSIGTAGSHGCIRMEISDVIDLYSQVPVNSPVYVE